MSPNGADASLAATGTTRLPHHPLNIAGWQNRSEQAKKVKGGDLISLGKPVAAAAAPTDKTVRRTIKAGVLQNIQVPHSGRDWCCCATGPFALPTSCILESLTGLGGVASWLQALLDAHPEVANHPLEDGAMGAKWLHPLLSHEQLHCRVGHAVPMAALPSAAEFCKKL